MIAAAMRLSSVCVVLNFLRLRADAFSGQTTRKKMSRRVIRTQSAASPDGDLSGVKEKMQPINQGNPTKKSKQKRGIFK